MARPYQEIQVFGIQNRAVSERTKRPWIVRWAVSGKQHSRSFRTKGEGERYRSLLTYAKTTGEAFDELSGEPLAWQPSPADLQAHIWARRWLAEEWPEWAPRTRVSALGDWCLSRVPLRAGRIFEPASSGSPVTA